MLFFDERQKALLKFPNFVDRNIVHKSVYTSKNRQHLIRYRHRLILLLLEQLHHSCTPSQLRLGGLVQFTSELCKGRHFPILGQIQTERSGHLFHGLNLRRSTYTGNRQSHVNGRTDTGIKQVCGQIDLAVGDGNHVCRNICRHVSSLRFNDWESR